ncbi:MobH family relaxase [Geoalkalibacter subterraneus]|uniref:MobH family relaxase n=1 Tax=Geoalkalibacter subterraneus TaxID=483547 RepID=UPI0011868317|nr:MobH family relaxase [Geoalkalibacter subterraneus]
MKKKACMICAMNLLFWRKKPKKTAMWEDEIPRYPPFARGLPLAPVDVLLEHQAEKISQIREAMRSGGEIFDKFYMPMLRRYAAFVHLLPASESHHHRGAGGLLRHGLEVALWSVQASDRVMFGHNLTAAERKKVLPRYEMATFIAGLTHDLGKPIADMEVVDSTGNHCWNPFGKDIVLWGEQAGIDRYYIRWRTAREHKQHEKFSAQVLRKIVPEEIENYLMDAGVGADPFQKMLDTIMGTVTGKNVIYDIVYKYDKESCAKDLRENSTGSDLGSQYGVPVERYLLDAMRRLIKDGVWEHNKRGARLWMLDSQLYCVWPHGAKDITEYLKRDNIPGIPQDPSTIAEILLDRDFIVPAEGDTRRVLWQISPEILCEKRPTQLGAIRFSAPDLLLDPAPASVPGFVTSEILSDAREQDVSQETEAQDCKEPSASPPPTMEPAPPEPWNEPASSESNSDDKEKHPQGTEKPSVEKPKVPAEQGKSHKAAKKGKEPAQSKQTQGPKAPPLPEIIADEEGETSQGAAQNKGFEKPCSGQYEIQEKIQDARSFFEEIKGVGPIFEAFAEDLAAGRKKWGQDATLYENNCLALAHPRALSGYGLDISAITKELLEQEWILPDPASSGLKAVREIDAFGRKNAKALIVNKDITALVLTLSEPGGKKQKPAVPSKSNPPAPTTVAQEKEGKTKGENLPPEKQKAPEDELTEIEIITRALKEEIKANPTFMGVKYSSAGICVRQKDFEEWVKILGVSKRGILKLTLAGDIREGDGPEAEYYIIAN